MTRTTPAATVAEVRKAIRGYFRGREPEPVSLSIVGRNTEIVLHGSDGTLAIPKYIPPGIYEVELRDSEGSTIFKLPLEIEQPEVQPEEPEEIDEPDLEAIASGGADVRQMFLLMSEMHKRELDGMSKIFQRQREMDREQFETMREMHRDSNAQVDRRVKEAMREFRLLMKQESNALAGIEPEAPDGLTQILTTLAQKFLGDDEQEGGEDEES